MLFSSFKILTHGTTVGGISTVPRWGGCTNSAYVCYSCKLVELGALEPSFSILPSEAFQKKRISGNAYQLHMNTAAYSVCETQTPPGVKTEVDY